MSDREYGHLRILVANQLSERADAVSEIARSLGHEVVALELDATTSPSEPAPSIRTSRSSASATAPSTRSS
jgi:hypothetical protein